MVKQYFGYFHTFIVTQFKIVWNDQFFCIQILTLNETANSLTFVGVSTKHVLLYKLITSL